MASFVDLLRSFSNELEKIARISPTDKAEAHHRQTKKDWRSFERNLKSKKFRKAITEHPTSDDKLRAYVKNYGDYLDSTDLVGIVDSRTSKKTYTIKRLPSGRMGCSCRDWQYRHSVSDTDCDHIVQLKKRRSKRKLSFVTGAANLFAQGAKSLVGETYDLYRTTEARRKARIAEENSKRLLRGEPLLHPKTPITGIPM